MATTDSAYRCQHCGLTHDTTCPRIKAIEYSENGAVKRIEFHEPLALPTTIVADTGVPRP